VVVANYPEPVKEFVVYTALRLLLFVASFAVVLGIWLAFSNSVPIMWVLVIALAISGLASFFVLNRQRERFARRVDERARKATAAFEAMKAREDAE
jgi:ABC-type bacteriocin/lantibiotic exporter with double-glycine peptidase domain